MVTNKRLRELIKGAKNVYVFIHENNGEAISVKVNRIDILMQLTNREDTIYFNVVVDREDKNSFDLYID